MGVKKVNRIKDRTSRVFQIFCYTVTGLFSVFCLFPFLLVISASLTPEWDISRYGYALIPRNISFLSYELMFRAPRQILSAYRVTLLITVVGTAMGLILMSMGAYVINRKDFRYRNQVAFYIYFTTLFSGGLVPYYILMVKYLHLKDSYLSMILPSMVSAWSIFLIRNFMKSIPDSLYESAKIDGAGDFRIYWQIVIPLSVPALATIGLFQALGYWNEWYNAMLYIQNQEKYPLQYFMQNMLAASNISNLISLGVQVDISQIPTESMKMAMAVVVTGPVVLFYPFVQRYFVSGLTIGAVKG